ncbi:MAG TPA: copper chaperone PCu(A)C [Hyphomicrobiaceae bacterium]|nr:copper chaperone PCu(A)C [Hyphomicrobiaceae bacterium]
MRGVRALLWGAMLALAAMARAPAGQAQGGEFSTGNIKIVAPWTRATPESSKVGGGFMTLINTGSEPDCLVGGSTEVSGSLEIHEIHIVNGVAMMRQVNPGILLKPGASVVLKPFSHHLMMMDLKQPLKAGEKIKGTLVFEKAGRVEIEYLVVPLGADGPAAGARARSK